MNEWASSTDHFGFEEANFASKFADDNVEEKNGKM
jgi:hypothetical protein